MCILMDYILKEAELGPHHLRTDKNPYMSSSVLLLCSWLRVISLLLDLTAY